VVRRKLSKFADFLLFLGLASFFVTQLPRAIVFSLLPAPVKVIDLAYSFGFNLQLIWNQLSQHKMIKIVAAAP